MVLTAAETVPSLALWKSCCIYVYWKFAVTVQAADFNLVKANPSGFHPRKLVIPEAKGLVSRQFFSMDSQGLHSSRASTYWENSRFPDVWASWWKQPQIGCSRLERAFQSMGSRWRPSMWVSVLHFVHLLDISARTYLAVDRQGKRKVALNMTLSPPLWWFGNIVIIHRPTKQQ